jgi:hypothetical protein
VMTGQFSFAVGEPSAAGASPEAPGAGHARGAEHGTQHGQH